MTKRNYDIKVSGQVIALVACVAGATIIAASGHDGWGWLVFIAILLLGCG
jgi:hypothetical protein